METNLRRNERSLETWKALDDRHAIRNEGCGVIVHMLEDKRHVSEFGCFVVWIWICFCWAGWSGRYLYQWMIRCLLLDGLRFQFFEFVLVFLLRLVDLFENLLHLIFVYQEYTYQSFESQGHPRSPHRQHLSFQEYSGQNQIGRSLADQSSALVRVFYNHRGFMPSTLAYSSRWFWRPYAQSES